MEQATPEVWFPNMGIKIMELQDTAVTIFGIPIYWYGVIIGTGLILGLALALREAKRTGQDADAYLDFTMITIITAIIGARLYYVIFSWDNYKDNLFSIFNLRGGGLAIYGGILAAIITAVIFTKKKKMNFWLFADTAAPSLILGQMLGRWGNFFNKEAFGDYTNSLFAMRYLKNDVRVSDLTQNILNHLVTVNGVEYIQVHPTFFYESLWNLGIFILLFWMQRKKKFHGEVFALYLAGYGLGRLWIEGLRTDQLLLWGTGIAVSQVVSLCIMAAGFGIFIWQSRSRQRNLL